MDCWYLSGCVHDGACYEVGRCLDWPDVRHDESCCMNGVPAGGGPHPGCPGSAALDVMADTIARTAETTGEMGHLTVTPPAEPDGDWTVTEEQRR